jgi:hypothetical protein
MTPNEKGRLCSKCQNTIIDFRKMTAKEIAEVHVFTKGKVCGFYRKEQLTVNNPKNKFSKLKPIYLSLFGILSTTNLIGQNQKSPVKTEQIEKDATNQNKTPETIVNEHSHSIKEDSLIVLGTMKDENGEILIGANVHIKGTAFGTTSDLNGFYFLDISEQIKKDAQISLIYSYTGFVTQEVVLNRESVVDKKEIKMDISFLGGELLSEFYVVKSPLHKRIWYKIKRMFKK